MGDSKGLIEQNVCERLFMLSPLCFANVQMCRWENVQIMKC